MLANNASVGQKVAIIGAGGIGFDVASFLVHEADTKKQPTADEVSVGEYMEEWGVDITQKAQAGLVDPVIRKGQREVTLLQRKGGKLGAGLGKTSGWVHRANLTKMDVNMIGNVEYDKVDDAGLHISIKDKRGDGKSSRVLAVDNVILCAGQLPLRELQSPLEASGVPVFRIGGAEDAGELDAKKAIDMATRLAIKIEDAKAGEVHTMDIGTGAKMIEYFRNFRNKKEGINQ